MAALVFFTAAYGIAIAVKKRKEKKEKRKAAKAQGTLYPTSSGSSIDSAAPIAVRSRPRGATTTREHEDPQLPAYSRDLEPGAEKIDPTAGPTETSPPKYSPGSANALGSRPPARRGQADAELLIGFEPYCTSPGGLVPPRT